MYIRHGDRGRVRGLDQQTAESHSAQQDTGRDSSTLAGARRELRHAATSVVWNFEGTRPEREPAFDEIWPGD